MPVRTFNPHRDIEARYKLTPTPHAPRLEELRDYTRFLAQILFEVRLKKIYIKLQYAEEMQKLTSHFKLIGNILSSSLGSNQILKFILAFCQDF